MGHYCRHCVVIVVVVFVEVRFAQAIITIIFRSTSPPPYPYTTMSSRQLFFSSLSSPQATLQQRSSASTAKFVRRNGQGSDYVYVDPKNKGSLVLVVGASSPSGLSGELNGEWFLKLDQYLQGQEVPPPKVILRMGFVGKRESEWDNVCQKKVTSYNEARKNAFRQEELIEKCYRQHKELGEIEHEHDKEIDGFNDQIRKLQQEIARVQELKDNIGGQKHQVELALTRHKIAKI